MNKIEILKFDKNWRWSTWEDIKMCDVMERAVNKGKEEVREEERINSIKVLISSLEEFGISSEDIIEKVMEKFNFSRDEATKYVNK